MTDPFWLRPYDGLLFVADYMVETHHVSTNALARLNRCTAKTMRAIPVAKKAAFDAGLVAIDEYGTRTYRDRADKLTLRGFIAVPESSVYKHRWEKMVEPNREYWYFYDTFCSLITFEQHHVTLHVCDHPLVSECAVQADVDAFNSCLRIPKDLEKAFGRGNMTIALQKPIAFILHTGRDKCVVVEFDHVLPHSSTTEQKRCLWNSAIAFLSTLTIHDL